MRIAIFSEVYWPMVSGVANTLGRTVEALSRRGHAVRVYSATYPLPDGEVDRSGIHRSPSRPLFVAPEVQWARPDWRAIAQDLSRFQPDVAHLATEFAMGHAGLRAARALGIPIVASAHTDYERYASRYGLSWAVAPGWTWLRWFYRHAEVVLAPTRVYEAHLHRRGIRHTGIWTRGVDADGFHPRFRSQAWRTALGLGSEDLLVAYVGRLAPEKGVDRLLDAWAAIAPRQPRAHLAFTGTGLMEPHIRDRGLPRVHLTGLRRGIELATAYASADVFVLPSVTETFGNVLLEAMASGVAPVAMASGGVLDYALDGVNARLVDPDAPHGLAEALEAVLTDRDLRDRLARDARATAERRSWDGVFDGLVARYQTALNRGLVKAA